VGSTAGLNDNSMLPEVDATATILQVGRLKEVSHSAKPDNLQFPTSVVSQVPRTKLSAGVDAA